MRRICCSAILVVLFTAAAILLPHVACAQQTGSDREYSLEQVQNTSTEVFLQRLAKPDPDYEQFAAVRALGRKARESSPRAKWDILKMVTDVMLDSSRSVDQRFKCCYVISDSKDEQWAPVLVHVLLNDPSETMRTVAASALADFSANAEVREGLTRASRQEKSQRVLDAISRSLSKGDAEYTNEQIDGMSAEQLLGFIGKPEPGYSRFSAMTALGKKAKTSDADTRKSIMTMVVAAMNDKSRSEDQRFQCCYVISACGDPAYLPDLIEVLKHDQSVTLRTVAAEAIGDFRKNPLALQALQQAYDQEQNQRVLDVISKYVFAAEYTAEQIQSIPADQFIGLLDKPEVGYAKFAAMHALGKKAKLSDSAARGTIMSLVTEVINDKIRSEQQRFQCCYVISECGDDQYVPHLIKVLNDDPSATMRSVAAEALGSFPKNAAVRSALLQAVAQETNEKVLEVLNRVIAKMNAA